MTSISSEDRRRLVSEIQAALRVARGQLALLNRQVGQRLDLKDGDLECLDLLARLGPQSPSALARAAGVHPATMTGVLDRLERAGWVARERDAQDRRAVVVRLLPDRGSEIFLTYSGMNDRLQEICRAYGPEELRVIADFLRRTAEAGAESAADLGR